MKINIIKHPLIDHKLAHLRDESCSMSKFRELIGGIGSLMVYEVTKDLETVETSINTPVSEAKVRKLAEEPVLVTILRAGIGMLDPFMKLLPDSRVGFLGMSRDEESLEPRSYYANIPSQAKESRVLLIDPMLATGGSAISAVDYLKQNGVLDIAFICLVAAPEGVKRLNQEHPDVKIFTAALDEKLNDNGYIVPGLGDAGDRIFGTK